MDKFVKYYSLKPGDEIIVPKSAFNIIQHHALYIGFDKNGTDWMIHNTIGEGVILINADTFFSICPHINEIRRFTGTNKERRQLVERALQKIGEPYNLIVYNCQHFTSEIKTGKPASRQVEVAVMGFAFIVAATILSSK